MQPMQSEQIGELAKALAAAQGRLAPAARNSTNPALGNSYADLASCIAACREVLPQHGLACSQAIAPAEPGCVCVETVLMHESGQWIRSRCTLPYAAGKGINGAQAAGSAITYARRYGLAAIVGLAAEDDDGSAASAPAEAPRRPMVRAAVPGQLSRRQLTALCGKLRGMGCATQEEYLGKACQIIGRRIKNSCEITQDEYRAIMRAPLPAQEAPAAS
ncbi:MAG: ERF family protein [Desulfovibrio sp.]